MRALSAVRQTFIGWGFRTRLLLILLLGLSAAVTMGLDWALGPVEQRFELGSRTLAGPLTAMLVVPLWNAALAGLYLQGRPYRLFASAKIGEGADLARVRQVLADVAGDRRATCVLRARFLPLVLLTLFVPNLALTGLARLNLGGVPAMSEHVVDAGLDGRLRVNGSGEAGLIPVGTDQVVVFNRPLDSGSFSLTDCADARCTRSVSALYEHDKDAATEFPPGFVVLGDGEFAVAAWTIEHESSGMGSRPTWGLRLHRCEGTTCDRTGGRVLARVVGYEYLWTHAARTSDGHLVIAHAGGQDYSPLRITSCPDVSCSRSHTVDTGVDVEAVRPSGAMTLTSDNQPVIAFQDDGGRLTVISCDTWVCESSAVARPLGRSEAIRDVDVAIGPDDRPAILYRALSDNPDYRTRFVRCSTEACDRATEVEIPGFVGDPVLALDSTGRPLITGTRYKYGNPFDEPEYALLLSCRDLACRQRDEVRLGAMEFGFGPKDMLVGPDDRPQILWGGPRSSDDKGRMRVTTCEQPRCGAR